MITQDSTGEPTDLSGKPSERSGEPSERPGEPSERSGKPSERSKEPSERTGEPSGGPRNPAILFYQSPILPSSTKSRGGTLRLNTFKMRDLVDFGVNAKWQVLETAAT